MRAVWIATVANIDWPSQKELSVRQQQNEFVDLLDSLEADNMNAVIVQVRPQGDAFYKSSFEPWSEYMSGKQGVASGDSTYSYDPLAFMIEESHKRGIEFHAWLNPYRISIYEDIEEKLDSNHIYFKHPEWFVKYGTRYYFNPGVKESEQFVNGVVKEIVEKYDVDAIHFDDYFYPYEIKDTPFPDSTQYANYVAQFDTLSKAQVLSVKDWRRDNVNRMVNNIHTTIKETKPWVRFGISPFGVWRNKSDDPMGSDTKAGQTNYDNLYADVLLWIEKGWVDYLTPQIYWRIGENAPAPYDVLTDWWNNVDTENVKMFIGLGAYKLDKNASSQKFKFWQSTEGYSKQIDIIRKKKNLEGAMHFSAKSFKNNYQNINQKLSQVDYRKPAIIPTYNGVVENTNVVENISASGSRSQGVKIQWNDTNDNKTRYFLIYRFDGEEVGNLENSENILAKVSAKFAVKQNFTDTTVKKWKKYTYVVTSVDRYNVESNPSKAITLKGKRSSVKVYN